MWNQTQKRICFIVLCLGREDDLNELIHRFDALIYLNRKYAPYLLDQNHQATTKSNKFDPTRVGLFIT